MRIIGAWIALVLIAGAASATAADRGPTATAGAVERTEQESAATVNDAAQPDGDTNTKTPAVALPTAAERLLAPSETWTPSERCADSGASFRLGCLTGGSVVQLLRQLCDYAWINGLCDATRFADPGYVTTSDPSPGHAVLQLVGSMHNHSGFSDGNPEAVPRDYYRAARTGHNTADSGGDTGIKLDFMWGSEHSDNGQIPITTSADCIDPSGIPDALATLNIARLLPPARCGHFGEMTNYWKWPTTLRHANEETERGNDGTYTGFTGIRGFEYTNDYYNHLNVFFSTNFVNVKIDGSYISTDVFWTWLREPVERGGGADGLVTFNHPGGEPHLSPFDSGLPHNTLLAQVPGGGNWHNYAYVPDVDDNVAGMEVNGGDDIEFYVTALTNGWHIGPVAAEDEHQLEWSTSNDGKTLLYARGRSPRDHYYAFQNQRTVAIGNALVGGTPGGPAVVPSIHYYADGSNIDDPAATLLGSTITSGSSHTLHFEASGLPAGSRIALVNNHGGQQAPIALGAANAQGAVTVSSAVTAPASGADWYFAVVCPATGDKPCGSDQNYTAVTAPIWVTKVTN